MPGARRVGKLYTNDWVVHRLGERTQYILVTRRAPSHLSHCTAFLLCALLFGDIIRHLTRNGHLHLTDCFTLTHSRQATPISPCHKPVTLLCVGDLPLVVGVPSSQQSWFFIVFFLQSIFPNVSCCHVMAVRSFETKTGYVFIGYFFAVPKSSQILEPAVQEDSSSSLWI